MGDDHRFRIESLTISRDTLFRPHLAYVSSCSVVPYNVVSFPKRKQHIQTTQADLYTFREERKGPGYDAWERDTNLPRCSLLLTVTNMFGEHRQDTYTVNSWLRWLGIFQDLLVR